jgi:hypothetical protein
MGRRSGITGLLWIWSGLAEEKKERFRYVLRPVDRLGLTQQARATTLHL